MTKSGIKVKKYQIDALLAALKVAFSRTSPDCFRLVFDEIEVNCLDSAKGVIQAAFAYTSRAGARPSPAFFIGKVGSCLTSAS